MMAEAKAVHESALAGQAESEWERAVRDLPEVVYTPQSALRRPGALLGEMLGDLGKSRELAWRLFLRDIRAQYRQSLLGYLWVLGPPLASTLLFVFLQSQRILRVDSADVPYPVFVLTGMVLWDTFASAVQAPLAMVANSMSMLSKLNFPREALMLTGLCHVGFNLAIRLVLLGAVFGWFGVRPAWTVVLAPLGIVALVSLGFVLGLVLVPLGVLYQDVARGLAVLLGAWMLLTPVIYPAPEAWPASLLNWINPVSPLVITTRESLSSGRFTQLPAFCVVLGLSLVLLLAGWVLYRLAMPHLVSRMSA